MSKKCNGLIQCPICHGKTKVDFRKPGLIVPITVRSKCSECDSLLFISVRLSRGNPGHFDQECFRVEPSEEGFRLIEEKQKAILASMAESESSPEVSNEPK